MNMRKSLLALLMALFMNCGAFAADQTARVTQTGDGNIANGDSDEWRYLYSSSAIEHAPEGVGIYQSGEKNSAILIQTSYSGVTIANTGGIHQEGDNLSTTIKQTANFGDANNRAFVMQVQYGGTMGSITEITQIGSKNEFWVSQSGEDGSAKIDQQANGDNNEVEMVQDGRGNSSVITIVSGSNSDAVNRQFGDDHAAIVSISGDDNRNRITQRETDNTATVGIVGDDNFNSIVQRAADNSATVSINGDNNKNRIDQKSAGNRAIFNIAGNRNSSAITQF